MNLELYNTCIRDSVLQNFGILFLATQDYRDSFAKCVCKVITGGCETLFMSCRPVLLQCLRTSVLPCALPLQHQKKKERNINKGFCIAIYTYIKQKWSPACIRRFCTPDEGTINSKRAKGNRTKPINHPPKVGNLLESFSYDLPYRLVRSISLFLFCCFEKSPLSSSSSLGAKTS